MRFDASESVTGDMNPCVPQVGDHHPDLDVWNLYHNHEVRPPSSLKFPPGLPQVIHTHTQGLFGSLIRFNGSLYTLVESQCSRAGQPCLSGLRRSAAVGSVAEGDNDMVPLKPGRGETGGPRDTVCRPSGG